MMGHTGFAYNQASNFFYDFGTRTGFVFAINGAKEYK
jgi:hypothetical protein